MFVTLLLPVVYSENESLAPDTSEFELNANAKVGGMQTFGPLTAVKTSFNIFILIWMDSERNCVVAKGTFDE